MNVDQLEEHLRSATNGTAAERREALELFLRMRKVLSDEYESEYDGQMFHFRSCCGTQISPYENPHSHDCVLTVPEKPKQPPCSNCGEYFDTIQDFAAHLCEGLK